MKKKALFGLTLGLLMTLAGCSQGGNSSSISSSPSSASSEDSSTVSDPSSGETSQTPSSESISTPESTSEDSSAVSDPSSGETSQTPSSESISTPESTSSDDSEEEETEVSDEPFVQFSVSEALAFIDTLGDNQSTSSYYEVIGYISSIDANEEVGGVKTTTFTISDSADGTSGLSCYRVLASDEILAQEYIVGTKVMMTGYLRKSVNEGVVTPRMTSCIVDILESKLVDATSMTMQETAELIVGKKMTLSVNWLPSNGRKEAITWSISSTKIATIDATSGELTGVAAGTATVKAKSASFTASCTLTVKEDSVQKATIEFKAYTGGDASTSTCAADKVISSLVSKGGNYLQSCTSAINVYVQPQCFRLGNSQKPGSVSFNLKNNLKISSVIIAARKYGSDVSNVEFAAVGYSGTLEFQTVTNASGFQEVTYELGQCVISAFTISNSNKRMFIESVSFVLDY